MVSEIIRGKRSSWKAVKNNENILNSIFFFLRLKTFLHDQLFPKDESQFGSLINSLTSSFQNIHYTVDSYMGIKHEQGKQKMF